MQHYYYRPAKQKPSKKGFKSGGFKGLLGPFMLLLLIIVLAFVLSSVYKFFVSSSDNKLLNYVEVQALSGEVFRQAEGEQNFEAINVDSVINAGDIVQVRPDSNLVLVLDSQATLDLKSSSEIKFLGSQALETPLDSFELRSGNLELDTTQSSLSKLSLDLDYVNVIASRFKGKVKAGLPIELVGLEGDVLINILDLETKSIYDEVLLSKGQKFSLDNNAYQSFLRLETPRVLSEYKGESTLTTTDEPVVKSRVDEVNSLSPVKILQPINGALLSDDRVIIKGTVPKNTEKVMVISFDTGKAEPYVLKEFEPGDTSFIYYASYEPGRGNIVIGENAFEVVAIDNFGKESLPARVEFLYQDKKALVKPKTPELKSDASAALELDGSLAPPTLLTINEQPFVDGYILTQPRGGLLGSVPADADKVVVNNFPLKFYKKGSGSFNYILSEKFSNLAQGANKISVYYVVGNKKSAVQEFTVNYN